MNNSPFFSQNVIPLQFSGFLKTPSLWTDDNNFPFPQFFLKEQKVPEDLENKIVIPGFPVLGKRIEYFFEAYLNSFTEEQVLAKNVQVRSGKITVGELDFLLKNRRTGEISHVELVYKFYVYDPALPAEEQRWIGPNKKDTLVKKLSKLKSQQFPLLFKEETKPLLDTLEIRTQNIKQKVCFLANLFIPLPLMNKNFPIINNECIQGFWIKYSEFNETSFGAFKFFSPKKQDWVIAPKNGTIWFSFSEIKQQLKTLLDRQKSPLLWMKINQKEYSRFFVVWWGDND